jgi:hypothetical protein
MAAQDGLTFEGVFNNSSTGLYKNNTTQDISEADLRALVTAIRESYWNRIDNPFYEHNRGDYAGTTAFPSTGGNYTGGTAARGDRWRLTAGCTVDGNFYAPGTVVEAAVDDADPDDPADWNKYQTL